MAKRNTPSPAGAEPPATFESKLEELEEAVRLLEQGDRPLEESLVLYEQGVKALQACHLLLNQAEQRLKILVQDVNGQPVLRPARITEDAIVEDPAGEDVSPPAAAEPPRPPAAPDSKSGTPLFGRG